METNPSATINVAVVNNRDLLDKIGGRKFMIAVFAILLGGIMVLAGKEQSANWLEFVKWVLGIFTAGNVLSNFAYRKNGVLPKA